jgi:pimeloyl-ACP methyl ester carboxylesterase
MVQKYTGHYTLVNGLRLYYEIHGTGFPLVLLHGGGSTIQSTFGRVLPELSKKYRIIAVELQAHGHTADINRPLSFEQDADDVAELLNQLNIKKANIMGFSNGGTTSLQIAIRHSHLVNKLVLISVIYKKAGMPKEFWEGMKLATLDNMPQPLKDAYLEVNPDPAGLAAMFSRDRDRMFSFKDISDEDIRNISVPTLIFNGDRDVVTSEHALELSHTLQNARLAILPGVHGECIGEICSYNKNSSIPMLVVEIIGEFL